MGNQIEKNEMGGACGRVWGMGEMHTGFGGKLEGNGPLGRLRCK